MKEHLMGHITSNPNKIKILEILKSKEEADEKTISKFARIPEKMLVGAIEDLKKDGIIAEKEGKLHLTALGFEILATLKGI
jgi:predicted transcriptional regulator